MKNKTFTVYIAGKITGMNLSVAETKFKAAQIELNKKGWSTITPFDIGITDDWLDGMLLDIEALMKKCDGIYLLSNWRTSRGARIERIIAQELGLFIAYQPK